MSELDQKLISLLPQSIDSIPDYFANWHHPIEHYRDSWSAASLALLCSGHLVFIRRSDHLRHHPSQLAFFGGRREADEATPQVTAAREFQEESAVDASGLNILGLLPAVATSSKSWVVPVVASIKGDVKQLLSSCKSNGEWSLVFSVPLQSLQALDWEHFFYHARSRHQVWVTTLRTDVIVSPREVHSEQVLWGATATMTRSLLALYQACALQ